MQQTSSSSSSWKFFGSGFNCLSKLLINCVSSTFALLTLSIFCLVIMALTIEQQEHQMKQAFWLTEKRQSIRIIIEAIHRKLALFSHSWDAENIHMYTISHQKVSRVEATSWVLKIFILKYEFLAKNRNTPLIIIKFLIYISALQLLPCSCQFHRSVETGDNRVQAQ